MSQAEDRQITRLRTRSEAGSVQRQLFLFAAGFTAITGCLTLVTLQYQRTQTLEHGEQLVASLAVVVQGETTRTLQSLDQTLRLAEFELNRLDADGALNQASARAVLSAEIEKVPFVRALFVTNAQGLVTLSSSDDQVESTDQSLLPGGGWRVWRSESGPLGRWRSSCCASFSTAHGAQA